MQKSRGGNGVFTCSLSILYFHIIATPIPMIRRRKEQEIYEKRAYIAPFSGSYSATINVFHRDSPVNIWIGVPTLSTRTRDAPSFVIVM